MTRKRTIAGLSMMSIGILIIVWGWINLEWYMKATSRYIFTPDYLANAKLFYYLMPLAGMLIVGIGAFIFYLRNEK